MATRIRRKATAVVVAMAALMVASITVATEAINPTPVAAAPDRNLGGRWGPVEDWPMVALHAALDTNGNVVTYGTNADATQTGRFIYDIWTPGPSAAAGHRTLDNTTRTDLFCSLQLNRTDTGDMLLFGGDNWTGTSTNNRGNPDINQIDAATGAISSLPGMNRSRWYATGTTMPNGDIYIQGGLDGEDRPERWSADRGAELLPIDTSNLGWYYPRNFVIPDGRIFGITTQGDMYYVTQDLQTLTRVGRIPSGFSDDSATAVMFEPGRILWFGGRQTEGRAIIIDVTVGGTPVITQAGRLSSPRSWVDATLLPDGRVLATGGAVKNSASFTDDPIDSYGVNNAAEIWDPRTGQWTIGAEAQVPRLYHSTALLLPDGRVLTAGGGSPGPIDATDAEIYRPDYLNTTDGALMPRPRITTLSTTTLTAGEALSIGVPDGADVARVTLVKSGSVTHSFNMEQRFVELDATVERTTTPDSDTVATRLPGNPALLTPGVYLLTILDRDDIPSRSRLITVEPSTGTPTPAPEPEPEPAPAPKPTTTAVPAPKPTTTKPAPTTTPTTTTPTTTTPTTTTPTTTTPTTTTSPKPTRTVTYVNKYSPQIRRLYLGYFRREPDQVGLTHWSRMRALGMPLVEVSNAFARSPEAIGRYGQTSNGEFVELVYRNVLGRAPDPIGRIAWLRRMSNGLSRGALMVHFTESPENISRVG